MIELWGQSEGQGPRLLNWWMGRTEADKADAAACLARWESVASGLAMKFWLKYQV
jgi:hypothetical protein